MSARVQASGHASECLLWMIVGRGQSDFRYDGEVTDFDSSSMRVSDADREAATTALGEHMSTGRLTIDEYGDRAARVSTAKTRRDVLELFDDLPRPWPDFSGVNQAAPTTPVEPMPKVAPAVRAHGGVGWAVAAAIPLTWLASVVAVLITGYWAIFLLPFLLTILGAVMLGRGVHRVGKRMIGNFSQATGFSGFNNDWHGRQYRGEERWEWYAERQGERWERRSERWQRHAERWQRDAARRQGRIIGDIGAQIGAEVQRSMREAYARNRRHHGRRR